MKAILRTFSALGCVVAAAYAPAAQAQIGEPSGSFEITVRQGGSIIASDVVTIGAGGQLEDLKPMDEDGTPESFNQIGSLGAGLNESPIILKVVADGDPDFRITHWYIDVPISLLNIYAPGPNSLFDPMGGAIDVTIEGLEFDNNADVIPFIVGNDTFYTSFMRDIDGHFYNLPDSHAFDAFGNGLIDVQVPGAFYTDANDAPYDFEVLQSGQTVSWRWSNILAPTAMTQVTNEFGVTLDSLDPGYVFELGLAVAFVQIPEPATLAMLAPAVLLVVRRRRK
jgi:hypothetical protein